MPAIKLLYVEDEPFLGKIVKESLESRQFEVCMVADGAKVMQALTDFHPDVCVLDVMLPNRDGFSLGAEIRAQRADLPIVFVTAKNQVEDVLKGFASGGNDYLRKPFSMEELIARIQNLLTMARGKTASSSDAVAIGKYEFFPQKYELHLGESTRKLSAREADVLKMLLDNRNVTVARKEILLKVWGDDHFFNSRNLDVYISKLRDYFREDSTIKIITIKGVGYHFTA